ncbi:hypothetical protein A2738_03340 [Candidatus Nomurabacteria bacterium RIFCSPHIGHO2_01_FULL_42_15]|uniref:Type 4a pilus biogenesis protein PilO n=1 Tax=Candidatus Nomurabacteria bacterium RIFCSPHIGHO2_01_FULL_42_15 TaxID=1801742 RepID=A0A1F6VE27_9BACT|nr:MAG: hypothetical protein A2738_03340 [Candidatus Nomurabacteria bacterium RIFCSPHIGHO2_01_FULL_42_15]OGI93232.1 MAG: hypothetical protein A3A99_03175 [Candidatus Nomurabacteria bacterium RIFCSPLOWO2_01_FULL_41_18]
MQSNFPKAPLLISIAFFVLSCLVFLFFYKATNENNAEVKLKETEWQKEASRRDEIKALDHSIKIIEGERSELETHFARSSDVVPFLNTVEGLARQTGAEAAVTAVDILPDRKSLMVGLKASGNFSGLYKFLTLLENSPYELEFVGMDMRRETEADADGKTSLGRWEAVFKIRLLSFVE